MNFNSFENIMEMEHLLLMSKCSIFHNILENLTFQSLQRCGLIINFNSFENIMENGAFAPHEQMFHFSYFRKYYISKASKGSCVEYKANY